MSGNTALLDFERISTADAHALFPGAGSNFDYVFSGLVYFYLLLPDECLTYRDLPSGFVGVWDAEKQRWIKAPWVVEVALSVHLKLYPEK